jgi:FMN phosphatase YigB (HAD superfamily)
MAILDFDGTLTDIQKEGEEFTKDFKRGLAALLNRPSVDRLWEDAEAQRAGRAHELAWNCDGFLTAPVSDPYLIAMALADMIFERLGVFSDPLARISVKDALFSRSYGKSPPFYREGADSFLKELLASMPVAIVSNSVSSVITSKLAAIGIEAPVYGDAKKNKIDPLWAEVPEGHAVEGLSRPVLLRRRLYFEVLSRISGEFSIPINGMSVMGDNYDLDLSLPQHLGASTALITRPGNNPYELKAAKHVVSDYAEARRFFGIV